MGMPAYGTINDAYNSMLKPKKPTNSKANQQVITENKEHLTEEEKSIADLKESVKLYGKVHETISELETLLDNNKTGNAYLERLHKFLGSMEQKIAKQYEALNDKIKNSISIDDLSTTDLYNLGGGLESAISTELIGSVEFLKKIKAFAQQNSIVAKEYYTKSDFIKYLRGEHPGLKHNQLKKLADAVYGV